jgi:hypothetical protein
MRGAQIFGLSFMDGFTFAGFFTPSRLPGAATTVFASTYSPAATAAMADEALEAKYTQAEMASRKLAQDRFNALLQERDGADERARAARRAVKR